MRIGAFLSRMQYVLAPFGDFASIQLTLLSFQVLTQIDVLEELLAVGRNLHREDCANTNLEVKHASVWDVESF